MDYLILNGNQDPANAAWEAYLAAYAAELKAAGAGARLIALRGLDIRPCTGCWSCWWATPGLCRRSDDMAAIYPLVLGADVTVWASPLVLGNVSALTKITQDRIVPLLHPYFELVNGESRHRRRYPKNIDMGLIVQAGPNDTAEDEAIVRRLHARLALNSRGRLRFFTATDGSAGAAAREAREALRETVAA